MGRAGTRRGAEAARAALPSHRVRACGCACMSVCVRRPPRAPVTRAQVPSVAGLPCGHGRPRRVVSVADVAAALVPRDTRLQLLVVDGAVLRAPGVAAWWAQGTGLGRARRIHAHRARPPRPTGPLLQDALWEGGLDHPPANALVLPPGQRDSQAPPSLLGGTAPAPPQMVFLVPSFSQLGGLLSPRLILTCSFPTAPSLLTQRPPHSAGC